VKPGLILEQEAEKSTYLIELDARKPLVVSISQRSEELIFYNLVLFDNFKPRIKSSIVKSISWLNGSFFGGEN
jgi:hypothetical protein